MSKGAKRHYEKSYASRCVHDALIISAEALRRDGSDTLIETHDKPFDQSTRFRAAACRAVFARRCKALSAPVKVTFTSRCKCATWHDHYRSFAPIISAANRI